MSELSDRHYLFALLQEARLRGMRVDKQRIIRGEDLRWPVDSRGYFVRNDGKLYEPSGVRGEFIHSQARFVLFYGSRGAGKTAAGAQKALRKVMQGESGAILNPDFENFKYSTWPEFKRWIPWNMVIPSQQHRRNDAWEPHQPFTMVFINGVRVYCRGLRDPDSARGPNINWLWYDEGGRDETGMGWRIAIASVRVGKEPQAWVTETPRPLDHWSYKFFIEKDIPDEALSAFSSSGDSRPLTEFFHGTIEENKENVDPGFYASLLASYPAGWMRTQEVYGEFASEGGKIGDRSWFNDRFLNTPPSPVLSRVRFWDLAATEKKHAKDDPDESVGTLLSKFVDGEKENFCIENQVGVRHGWDRLLQTILNVAMHDGVNVPVVIEEEPGSGGKNQVAAIQEYLRKAPGLSGVRVVGQSSRKVGDRIMAANHWFSAAAQGRMWIVRGSWNEAFLSQLDGFTQVRHDDRITSVSGAFFYISPPRAWARIPFRTL